MTRFEDLFKVPRRKLKADKTPPTCPTPRCSNIVEHPTHYCYDCIEAANR